MNLRLDTPVPSNIKQVYLAGPMRGRELLNFPLFHEVANHLRKLGLGVTSPAEKDIQAGYSGTNQRPWIECACEDALEVLKSDAVVVLPGWEGSRGTRFEIMAALAADVPIPILDAETLQPIFDPLEIISKYSTAYRKAADLPASRKVPDGPVSDPNRSTNPKDILGLKKAPLRLVPPALIIFVSKVMGLGAKKYGPYNWRDKRIQHTVYLEAALRHILSSLDGEDTDPESGMPHEAHAAACMGIILDAKSLNILIDDRPKPGAASKLITQFTEKS